MIFRTSPIEYLLYKGPRVDTLGWEWQAKTTGLLGLPLFLDAVIDKSHETSCNDDAEFIRFLYNTVVKYGGGGGLTRQRQLQRR